MVSSIFDLVGWLSRNDHAVISAIIATATHPYFKLRWLHLKPSLNNKENEEFVKKVVVNSLETLDQNDSPENSASSDVDEILRVFKEVQDQIFIRNAAAFLP